MNTKNLLAGAFALSLLGSTAQAAAVNYIGNATDGDLTTIIDLAARTIRSAGNTVSYADSAAFASALGGSHSDATSTSAAQWVWPAEETFVLEDNVFITNGNLVIAPGSVVRGQPRSGAPFDGGSLFIARGAKILAQGGVGTPIVFTTAALNNSGAPGARASGQSPTWWDSDPVNAPKAPFNAGLWGGLVVLGNAITNSDRLPGTPTQEFNGFQAIAANADDRFEIEGVPAGDASTLGISRFGGFEPNDNSGEISYVSLRHGGANLTANNEVNGLTLGAVGRGTTVRYVEVWGNTDDGIEIFGGSVNLDHIVVVGQQDDGIDLDVGYTGTIQYALVINSTLSDKLGEWDGSYEVETSINGVTYPASGAVASSLLPTAQFVVANATLIGNPGGTSTTSSGLHIRDQAAPRLVNSIIVNPSKQGSSGPIEFDNRSTGAQSTLNLLDKEVSYFKGVSFYDASGALTDVNTFVDNGSSSNTIARNKLGLAKFQNEFNVDPGFSNIPSGNLSSAPANAFNPRPTSAAGAVFEDDFLAANSAFQSVSFRGAFDPNEANLWTLDWTAAEAFGLLVE